MVEDLEVVGGEGGGVEVVEDSEYGKGRKQEKDGI